ncbi:unnamed protein product [marine sediment metagenome]|uniref:Uncharacterized protein n=1 Tax=marine sediment metagenome TaxID=412755 RepID=X1SS95_9ZZZZ
MADLNENNAKLMNDVKKLNQKIIERDDFLKEKERKIEELSIKLTSVDEFDEKTEIMLQEKKDLITINVGLNSEIKSLEKEFKNLKNEVEKSQNQITIHIDTITNLKLDTKNLKSKISSTDEEKEKLKDQSISSMISPFGALITGPLAEVLGARVVFLLCSIIGVVATSYTWHVMKVKKIDYDDNATRDEITEKINNINGEKDGSNTN